MRGTLRRDEWKQLDDAVLAISRQRLGGIEDLVSNGLVFGLGNAMGTTVLEYHDISDAMTANPNIEFQNVLISELAVRNSAERMKRIGVTGYPHVL